MAEFTAWNMFIFLVLALDVTNLCENFEKIGLGHFAAEADMLFM
jgi:hypothetical protein